MVNGKIILGEGVQAQALQKQQQAFLDAFTIEMARQRHIDAVEALRSFNLETWRILLPAISHAATFPERMGGHRYSMDCYPSIAPADRRFFGRRKKVLCAMAGRS